jgi:dihydrolipoamide dehydrogenase
MEVDVAVLGGGPGGYTAAIRAAQLGAKVACIEKEPELGGTCLRVGCIPTKAWVQTAFALKEAEEHFAKFGVQVGEAKLDFPASNAWKAGVVKQMTSGVASLFKAAGVEWVKGAGHFTDANTIAVEGGEDVTFKQAIVATGSYPIRPPIPGLESPRCVDSTGLLAQEQVPRRLAVLGGGIIGSEFASIFNRFGSEVTIVEMLTLIPQEDEDASEELAKQFGKRGITLHLGKQCTRVEDDGSQLTVHFGEGETIQADLMLVSVGRAPLVEGIGLEAAGVEFDARTGIGADRLLAARPHGVPGGRDRGRERVRPRGGVQQPRDSAADLHGSRDRSRRAHRGAGAGGVRRRRRGGPVPVDRECACGDAGRDRRLGEVDP